MYRDTVTLFNRYHTRQEDFWYPTVLRGVDLNADKATINAKYGAAAKDNAILHVRVVEKYNPPTGDTPSLRPPDIMVAGKRWLPPKEWRLQPEEELKRSLTFAVGEYFDFFFEGEWDRSEPFPDSEYSPEGFYDYMNQRYDRVYAITSATGYSLIPHLEITGK